MTRQPDFSTEPRAVRVPRWHNLALAGDKTVPYNAAPFEGLMFSLWSPQTDTAVADYWIDDVAISKQRINCPTAL